MKKIQSQAYRSAREIEGTADALATDIYADAYGRSAESREFYQFIKTMETLEQTFDEDTRLILSTDGEYFRYLKSSGR